MPVTEIMRETIPLHVSDRCDLCGAQAFVRIAGIPLPGEGTGDLLLCGHHFARNELALLAGGYDIQDERDRINQVRSSGTAD